LVTRRHQFAHATLSYENGQATLTLRPVVERV
jgi:hypothetical protein